MSIWEAMETLAVARQVVDGLRRHGDHTLPFERCTTCQHSLGALDDRLRVYEAVMGSMSTSSEARYDVQLVCGCTHEFSVYSHPFPGAVLMCPTHGKTYAALSTKKLPQKCDDE